MANQASAQEPGFIGRAKIFGAEVRSEMEKVTWPTQEDLKASTTVVMMFLALFAAIVGVMDVVLQNVVLWMFKLT
jgi:preprotein translocase subunit SecE